MERNIHSTYYSIMQKYGMESKKIGRGDRGYAGHGLHWTNVITHERLELKFLFLEAMFILHKYIMGRNFVRIYCKILEL